MIYQIFLNVCEILLRMFFRPNSLSMLATLPYSILSCVKGVNRDQFLAIYWYIGVGGEGVGVGLPLIPMHFLAKI